MTRLLRTVAVHCTAAVSVFPVLFFPKGNSTTALLASLATFGLAFVARPLGSILFGHFGDRVGRKATLVSSLLTMGIATFLIGVLPTYSQAGLVAPALLAILRFCQGLALGGEWSGAALLATEGVTLAEKAQLAKAASVCGDSFRSECRLCAAIFVSLRSEKQEKRGDEPCPIPNYSDDTEVVPP